MSESYRPTFGTFNTRMINYDTVAGTTAATNIPLHNLDGSDVSTKAVILNAKVSVPVDYTLANKLNVLNGTLATTNIAVASIATADTILECLHYSVSGGNLNGIADLTSEVSITSAGNIQLSTTDTSGDLLVLKWQDASLLPDTWDITNQIVIPTTGNIQVSTDDTTGFNIDLIWLDPTAVERPYVEI